MKVAFIHHDKKISTGAHYINDLIKIKLKERGIKVRNFYPNAPLIDSPHHLRGLKNILFFYSLLEHKDEILKCDLIQGTTYTPLTFIPFDIPVISHFGSTTYGFLKHVARTHGLEKETGKIFYKLRKLNIISELNLQTRKPLRDIMEIENYVASKADAVIATSLMVKDELRECKIDENKIELIHNAVEDYWYDYPPKLIIEPLKIVFLNRLGSDVFTFKLKGLDRLINLYDHFPRLEKITIAMTTNNKLVGYLIDKFPNQQLFKNVVKNKIPEILNPLAGSIFFLPSRYEGFSLSLIESMTQGLIPIAYPVGVAQEVIINGENGFIVNNQEEARVAIERIVNNNDLRLEMSQNAYKTSLAFKADLMVDKFIALYKKVLQNYRHKKENVNLE
jgi:glycosyltransferase involved in cell wall biosynthesis